MVVKRTLDLTNLIDTAKQTMTLSTLYVLTDAFYDYGLVKLPSPLSEAMYYGRYVLLIFCFLRTKYLNHRKTNKVD